MTPDPLASIHPDWDFLAGRISEATGITSGGPGATKASASVSSCEIHMLNMTNPGELNLGLAIVPNTSNLRELRAAASECRACPLYLDATQTVFGEGKSDSEVMLVGEQPGDQEDVVGKPFVGPAGGVLDRALAEVGIDRRKCFVTNAVKHFKWKPAGKRRIHEKPSAREIEACRPWLDAEMRAINPRVIICLGATAVRAVFRQQLPILRNRGHWVPSPFCPKTLITVHPSSILRERDPQLQKKAYQDLVADLTAAAKYLHHGHGSRAKGHIE